VAADRAEIAGLGQDANVETVTGERLYERRASAVLDRGESQFASSMCPTLT
jgi:hypothetical protein